MLELSPSFTEKENAQSMFIVFIAIVRLPIFSPGHILY